MANSESKRQKERVRTRGVGDWIHEKKEREKKEKTERKRIPSRFFLLPSNFSIYNS